MKIYKLYKIEYRGGMGLRVDEFLIGYYDSADKASTEADRLAVPGEDIVMYYPKQISNGWLGLYMTLGGDETTCPHHGYVIEEIEVH